MTPGRTLTTTCCYCGVGCGIEVTVSPRGRLSLRGDPQHPGSRGSLCSKGRTLLHVVASREDRLLYPQVRLDRTAPLGRTTWDAALGHVANEFRRIIAQHGPDAVAFYGSGQLLTEEYYVINKLMKGFIGTNNFDTNSRLCMSSAVVGYKQTLGVDGPPTTYEDFDHADTFLVTGSNAAFAHPIIWRRVEARKEADPNVRIIVIDPRTTATCAAADLHLQLIPGTDTALHYALAQELIRTEAIDRPFIEAHVEGFAAFAEAAAAWPLERAAAFCGLRAEDIAQAAAWLAGDRRFLSLWTMGLNQSSSGVDKNTTLIALSLITGKIGTPGNGPFSLTGQPNAMGGREVGGMANLAPFHRDLTNPDHRAEVARHWGVPSIPAKPGLTAVELFDALHAGTVKAVWIAGTNPVESLPNAHRIDEALKKAELVVVNDCYPTATTDTAHVVLPAATWLEKSGTMTSSERRVTLLNPAVAPPGEALPDAEILCRFAETLGWGPSFPYFKANGAADIYAEHVALSAGRDCDVSGLSHERLAERSYQWPVPTTDHPGTPRLYTDHRFPTASGKATLKAPAVDHRTETTSAEFPLILTTGRLRDQWHTQTKTGRVHKLQEHAPEPFAEIHPIDATARGLVDGDLLELRNPRGTVQVRATVTDTIRPGVVFLPMHWGRKLAGLAGRTNNLANPSFDPVSKEPDLKFAAVEARKVTTPPRSILIVGGGAAAHGFLEHHAAAGLTDRITIFGDEAQPFYDRVQLPHLVAGLAWERMVKATPEHLAARRVQFRPGLAVTAINRQAKTITTADGADHAYDILILATGSRAARHYQGPVPPRGVHTLRRRGDAEAIREQAGPGRHAVVVGGGLLGLELADALRGIGSRVTVLQRSERLMGKQLDTTAAGLLARALEDRGIAIRFKTGIDELLGTDHLTGIRLAGGQIQPCDLVIFATGTTPNAELARTAGLTCSTGVVIDEHLRTSDPAIYALGEVADFRGQSAATTAAAERQAWHLVETLRGNPHAPYPGPQNPNILKVEGVLLGAAGEVDPDPGTAEVVTLLDEALGTYQKLVVRNDRLVGAICVGDLSSFADYRRLIATGTELDDRRATLLRGGAAKPIEGKLVCSCNQVGEDTITRCIAGGERNLAKVCAATGAGTSCGSCRPEVARLIERR